jgi:energy-coupling factor transporter ATP-binding protein EcfA2
MESIDLNDGKIDGLTGLIKDSFRVRPNQNPVYVDVSGNLDRVSAPQHQIVFGRRGSGKSCLLVHFHRVIAPKKGILTVYIDADELKRLGYPDVLIRLLLRITEDLAKATQGRLARLLGLKRSPLWKQVDKLRTLLDSAEESDVTHQVQQDESVGAESTIKAPGVAGGLKASNRRTEGTISSFKAKKLEALERNFPDFKQVLQSAISRSRFDMGAVIVDDFYLFDRTIQPDVLDYLHRLLRGTDLYLKVGTVRHRTTLQRSNGQTIGIDLNEDVEEISLDRTFEHVDSTREFLELMLNSMGREVGLENSSMFMSQDGQLALTLASGGVPRDYLNTLVEAVPVARNLGQQRVTPRTIYKGAGRLSYRTKLANLRDDAGSDAKAIELVFADLARFCLKEERKTGFLISQEEVQTHPDEHEIIQQLMDFKLVHIIEPDTSAASGRRGRFEAYTLDFSLFMEPRLRGIKHIEFWKTDEQRRREGVREAPHYSLERAQAAASGNATEASEGVLEELEREVGVEESSDTLF